jgi:hypothetical protein
MNNQVIQGATLLAQAGAKKVTRQELSEIPIPEATRTHQPLSHYEIVNVLEEALSFRMFKVLKDEYAVSLDGMKMFGIMELNSGFTGCRFSIGIRNSNDKSMRLALTVGLRVLVCSNMAFSGDFTPMFQKHTRNLSLIDSISIAVDRIHRGFKPLEEQVNRMKELLLPDSEAKLIIYQAFLDKEVRGLPRHLLPIVHEHYFQPKYDAFQPRTLWSLSNAFTSSFKELNPLKQFEVTAKFGSFLTNTQETVFNQHSTQFGQVTPFPKLEIVPNLEEIEPPKALAFNNTSAAIQFQKVANNQAFNQTDYPNFDDDDIPDDPYDDELFDKYFDQAEAEEEIDEATEKLVEEYERKVA